MLSSFKALGHNFCRIGPWAVAVGLCAGCGLSAPLLSDPVAASPVPAAVAPAAPAVIIATPPFDPDAVAALLAYVDRVRGLQGAELTQEIARLGDAPRPADQVRLAVALSQTRQLYDLVRAQELLQRVLANSGDDALPLQTMARLLAARFAEQRRLEDQLDKQTQQLRDLQRRLDQTQEKLDALREIERSLSSRPAAGPASAPTASPAGRARPATP